MVICQHSNLNDVCAMRRHTVPGVGGGNEWKPCGKQDDERAQADCGTIHSSSGWSFSASSWARTIKSLWAESVDTYSN